MYLEQPVLSDGEPPAPAGAMCRRCRTRVFPRAARCRNCGSAEVLSVQFPREGQIVAFTTSGEFGLAEIELDDGFVMFGQVTPLERMRNGARVRFAPRGGTVRFVIHD